MTLLDDIALAISGLVGYDSLYQYHVLKNGQVVFSTDMSDYTVTAMCVIADPLINLNSIPDRFTLAATYWILHRYWSTKDANQSNYYHQLYDIEWAKVQHNRLHPAVIGIGTDL
jgi:hypothetical protein